MRGSDPLPVNALVLVVIAMIFLVVTVSVLMGKLKSGGDLDLESDALPIGAGIKIQALYQGCNTWYRSDFIDITMPSQVPEYSQKLALSSKCVPEDAQKEPSLCYDVCIAVLKLYTECAETYPPTEACWNSPLRGRLGE